MNHIEEKILPGWWRALDASRKTRLTRQAGLFCLAVQLVIAAARLAGGEGLAGLASQGTFLLLLVPLFFIRFEDRESPQ